MRPKQIVNNLRERSRGSTWGFLLALLFFLFILLCASVPFIVGWLVIRFL